MACINGVGGTCGWADEEQTLCTFCAEGSRSAGEDCERFYELVANHGAAVRDRDTTQAAMVARQMMATYRDLRVDAERLRDGGWRELAKEAQEGGECPACFETDEGGHRPGCTQGELEAEVARLRATRKEVQEPDILRLQGNCAEFVTDDGRRFAWSDSNCHYEEVAPDGGAFTTLRNRLRRAEAEIKRLKGGTP